MNTKLYYLLLYVVLLPLTSNAQTYAPTPQDKGLPYTRTAIKNAQEAIKGTVVLFPESRYAYVDGKRVRLDNENVLEGEAFVRNSKLYAPVSFAKILASKNNKFSAIPKGLEVLTDRWVYTMYCPSYSLPKSIATIAIGEKKYFAVSDLATYLKKHVFVDESGLLLISDKEIVFNPTIATRECVITLFDTPEKYADPSIATRYIPTLKAQGNWYDQARVTAAQLLELEHGLEHVWPITPQSAYDLSGFNHKMLGSSVPALGVYPRLLFSENDLAMLRKHVSSHKMAAKSLIEIEELFAKSWWDEKSSDGKIFKLLIDGKIDEINANQELPKEGAAVYHVAKLTKDHKPVIYNSHINYVSNSLTTMAFYALLKNDKAMGRKIAKATISFYQLIEPRIEVHLATSDSEFGISFEGANHASTHWRGMHGVVPHMDLAFSLDFAGKWMTAHEKRFMQLLIAKASYGRRTGAGDGPKRNWRDHNHMTWHLTHLLSLLAIEGLDGFDHEAYLSGRELVRDFLEFGIDNAGQAFESNGKSGGGIQFQLLSMIALARRGNNLFGHPHLRKLLAAQVHTTSPNGQAIVSSGTWGGSALSPQFVAEMKCFFPHDKSADFLLTHAYPHINPASFDTAAYRLKIRNNIARLRMPGPTYPSLVMAFPYISDWEYTPTKQALQHPLTWQSNAYGMFAAASNSTANAAWLCMQVRHNHYLGTGHHHADAGMFYFSGNGVNWITESPFPKSYNAKYHNMVLINGVAQSDMSPAKAEYLGMTENAELAEAMADLSYAYSWEWCTQVNKWGQAFSATANPYQPFIWELETKPEVFDYFRGTTKYKMRPWCATSNQSNFMPTLRAPWNPVEYALRKTTLYKGKYPFALIADDIKKDAHNHLYQWSVMPGPGVWKAEYPALPQNCMVLAYSKQADEQKNYGFGNSLQPKHGDPLLLVCALGMTDSAIENLPLISIQVEKGGNDDDNEKTSPYTRLNINSVHNKANFRVLLLPFNMGDELPHITYNGNNAVLQWKNHKQEMALTPLPNPKTQKY